MSQVQTAKGSLNGSSFPLPAITPDWANGERLAISSSNAQSAAVSSTVVLLRPTVDCFITVGASPTASTSLGTSFPLVANEMVTIPLTSGQKIGCITTAASGYLYILPAAV